MSIIVIFAHSHLQFIHHIRQFSGFYLHRLSFATTFAETETTMIKSIFALFLIISSISVNSQITIGGIVKDEKGISLSGANIYFRGTYECTSSDASGVFKIQTNLKGKQILLVEFLGFEKFSKELLIDNKDIQLEIILKEALISYKL